MHSITTTTIFRFLIIVTLITTTGCGSRSHKFTPSITNAHLKQYTMHVHGVECKFCAQTVIDLVLGLPGVSNVRYHTTDDTYQVSYLTFVHNQESGALPTEQLKAGLVKEGFSLVSLKNRSQEPLSGVPVSGK